MLWLSLPCFGREPHFNVSPLLSMSFPHFAVIVDSVLSSESSFWSTDRNLLLLSLLAVAVCRHCCMLHDRSFGCDEPRFFQAAFCCSVFGSAVVVSVAVVLYCRCRYRVLLLLSL